MSDASKKRKAPAKDGPPAKRPRFPIKPQHNIKTPKTATAYPNGELNVSHFLRAHENEIKALENAMKIAKKGLSRRAFQDVPRDLRRRTGSHNPQRVPKRLRMQARKEAIDDNTPISKNKSGSGVRKGKKKWLRMQGIETKKKERRKKKAKDPNAVTITADPTEEARNPPTNGPGGTKETSKAIESKTKRKKKVSLTSPSLPPSRFRRRQLYKTWLPTHVWHAKRATMTPSKEPLWRFAIPLSPILKGYRLTHRAASLRGAVAWDTSYMATIGVEGAEGSILGLLKALRFAEEAGEDHWKDSRSGKKWRAGFRAMEGWTHERERDPLRKIALVTVVWSSGQDSHSKKKKVFIRVHPTAFLQLWNEVLRTSRVQKPGLTVEDLRFEIGSIEVMGPAAAETLCAVLKSSSSTDVPEDVLESTWPNLSAVTDVGALPSNALLAFTISDPRLRDPIKSTALPQNEESQQQLIEMLANWPFDRTQDASGLFDRNTRLAAGHTLPSQKSINRRKSAALPGQHPESRSTDPRIPLLIHAAKSQNRWIVSLPWKCVLPVWQCMMRYAVSTGGNPRFGGLKETRQVNYERSTPSFPFDFPGTDAGWAWELQQREDGKQAWVKKPKGKRIEWSTIDLGNGRKGEIGKPWACEWKHLVTMPEEEKQNQSNNTITSPFRQLHAAQASQVVAGRLSTTAFSTAPHLFTVKVSMFQHGVPTDCARIYRLPTNNAELRTKWLSLMPIPTSSGSPKRTTKKDPNPNPKDKIPSKHHHVRALAQNLLEPSAHKQDPTKVGSDEYPLVPDEEDLIGFVTTGNYNLAEGMPTAIANIVLHKVVQGGTEAVDKEGHVCIVREAGRTFGRLATWQVARCNEYT